MGDPKSFLVIVQNDEFYDARKNREIIVNFDMKLFDRLLFAIVGRQNIRTLIAEYEIVSVTKNATTPVYGIEPIYVAPLHNGIVLNELVYLKLSTYQNVEEWELALKRRIVNISNHDFTELATKLAI